MQNNRTIKTRKNKDLGSEGVGIPTAESEKVQISAPLAKITLLLLRDVGRYNC